MERGKQRAVQKLAQHGGELAHQKRPRTSSMAKGANHKAAPIQRLVSTAFWLSKVCASNSSLLARGAPPNIEKDDRKIPNLAEFTF